MKDFQQRIVRLMSLGGGGRVFGRAPALFGESDTDTVAQPCVNGVIPWNPSW